MNGTLLILVSVVLLLAGYRWYGGWIARKFGVDWKRPTPAHTQRDDQDYLPTPRLVVFGHHFASIAGAAPIIGPITAISFGWMPALIWLLIGGVFLGAVHDFSALMASLRHQGLGMGEIIHREIGKGAKILFLTFTWLTLILVIAVFASIVAKGFVSSPASASSSVYFIGLAVVFGVVMVRRWISFRKLTLLGILLLFAGLWFGLHVPLSLSWNTWLGILFVYVILASVLPVWTLLQPRDYLSSFLLYGMLILGLIAMVFARPELQMPAWGTLWDNPLGALFPFLFVTIACGAISGFHSVVASGTTSRQLNSEKDAQPVAFGAMLTETLLAVLALVTAAYMIPGDYAALLKQAGPIGVFSTGLSGFSARLGIPAQPVMIFATLTVSSFALTTLDSATRLARYAWQELFSSVPWLSHKWPATIISAVCAALLAGTGLWKQIWPLFGAANQLLAALALLTVYVWMRGQGKGGLFFLLIPMIFMYSVTVSALATLAWRSFSGETINWIVGPVAILLLLLALVLLRLGFRSLRSTSPDSASLDSV